MAIRRRRIRQLAQQLIEENNIKHPPVLVEQIIESRGIQLLKEHKPSSNVSGFIARRGGATIIGVNSSQASVRQRFTLAHELGHHLLHAQGLSEVHVDETFEVKFRDERSSLGTDLDEREANLFAAELLMPQHLIEEALATQIGIDISDDDVINELAENFGVSTQAMLFRLANLGYIAL